MVVSQMIARGLRSEHFNQIDLTLGGKMLRFTDDVPSSIRQMLRNQFSFPQSKEPVWRSQLCTGIKGPIKEVQHLRAENGMMAADEDQHLAWLDDALLRSSASLLGWLQAKHFIGGHQWPLNVINARVDVTHNRREPRAAEVVTRFLDCGRACHFAQEFGCLELVGCESDAHVAVRNDAFVITVGIDRK